MHGKRSGSSSGASADKNLCTPPTSRGSMALSFGRVIEATIVCLVLVPLYGKGTDLSGNGQVDAVSAFQLKTFLAVYLAIASFACLLGAAVAEQLASGNHVVAAKKAAVNAKRLMAVVRASARLRLSPSKRPPDPTPATAAGQSQPGVVSCQLQLWAWLAPILSVRTAGFLPPLLISAATLAIFAGELVYEVYLDGNEGSRRCRSVVLLSLLTMCAVTLVCLRILRHTTPVAPRLFFSAKTSTPLREQAVVLALIGFVFVLALLLGLADDVSLADDLGSNPVRIVTSRCHSAALWRDELESD